MRTKTITANPNCSKCGGSGVDVSNWDNFPPKCDCDTFAPETRKSTMNKPREDWQAPIHGASVELISAMSALNMEPSPIKSPDVNAIYLSETDEMARHSYEHMQAAMTCLIKAQQQLENLARATEQVLHVCHGVDWDTADGEINPSVEWLTAKLTELYKNKRGA